MSKGELVHIIVVSGNAKVKFCCVSEVLEGLASTSVYGLVCQSKVTQVLNQLHRKMI